MYCIIALNDRDSKFFFFLDGQKKKLKKNKIKIGHLKLYIVFQSITRDLNNLQILKSNKYRS